MRHSIPVFFLSLRFEIPAFQRRPKDVKTWIGYAVKHNVKVLDVNLDGYDKAVLPRCIFTCRSLQELNLQMGEAPYDHLENEGLVLPDVINLPSLKKLTLCDVEVDTLRMQQIIDRSPGLEEVCLINCAQYLDLIDSKVLKRLTIDGAIGGDKGLTIAAPHLVHFECIGWPLDDISWREQPSLESGHIDTCGRTFDSQSNFTRAFLHAKGLALFGSDMKVMLEKELPTCSEFENLATLEIGEWCLTDDFYVVLRILQLSSKLEKLTLKDRKLQRATKEAEADPLAIDGMSFQCPLLETVIIQCSKDDGENKTEKLVNAMVANGVSLEKIHVTFYEDIEKRELAERMGAVQKEERASLERSLKENEKWVDDSAQWAALLFQPCPFALHGPFASWTIFQHYKLSQYSDFLRMADSFPSINYIFPYNVIPDKLISYNFLVSLVSIL
ncbi:hypothetical protein ACP4OV_019877 [Aristida adscensionis]